MVDWRRPSKKGRPQALIAATSGGGSKDLHRAFHVVGEHVPPHLGTDAWDRRGEKVRCSHPGLDRAKRMLHSLAAYP